VNTHSKTQIIACLILLILTPHCISAGTKTYFRGSLAIHSEQPSWETIKTVGFLAGAVGLAYGVIQFSNWLFRKSDEDTTELVQQTMREVTAQFTGITTILNNAYAGHSDRESCITNISEPVLHAIARAKYHDADIALYLKRLSVTLKKIEKQSQDLHKRIQHALAQPTPTHEIIKLISRMKVVENQIQATLPSLYFAYDYLNHHASYFALFETEDSMMYRYERDLHAIDSCQGDMHYLQDMIHQSVMLYQRRLHNPYPYRWYLKRLEEDIYALHVAINHLSYTYPDRYDVASALCYKLEKIREALIGSPYYSEELRAYEYAKLAQAAIAAQQMQAQALQQQALELQRQNELQAQALQQANTQIFVM
jgi:hypothetical protein